MKFDYTVTKKDIVKFNKYHIKNSLHGKIIYIFMCVIIPMYLYYSVMKDSVYKEEGILYYISAAIVIVIIGVILFFVMGVAVDISVRLSLMGGNHNDFIGKQTIVLYDDYIEESNANITSRINYTSVEKICFGNNCIYIYIGTIKAIVITGNAFINAEQKQNFLNLLGQKTGLSLSDSGKKIVKRLK